MFSSYLLQGGKNILYSLPLAGLLFLITVFFSKRRGQNQASKTGFLCWWYLAFLVVTLLWNRSSQPYYAYNLYPLKNMLHSIYFFDIEALTQFLINYVLFVPAGLLLAVQWKESRRYYWVPVICFTLSLVIEFIQYVLRLGIADIDDILINTMGAAWGWSLHGLIRGENRLVKWGRFLAASLPIVICCGIIGHSIMQPYGRLACEEASTKDLRNVSVDYTDSFQNTQFPEKVRIYKLNEGTIQEAEIMIDTIFQALNTTLGEKISYDNCFVCYSQKRTLCIWYYIKERRFELINFNYVSEKEIDFTSIEGAYDFFENIGIHLPQGMEYAQDSVETITLTANFLESGKTTYDGEISIQLKEGHFDTVVFALYQLEECSYADILSKQQLKEAINAGRFYCSDLEEIHEIACQTLELKYALDSRNYYRPYFSIQAIIDGAEKAILVSALQR